MHSADDGQTPPPATASLRQSPDHPKYCPVLSEHLFFPEGYSREENSLCVALYRGSDAHHNAGSVPAALTDESNHIFRDSRQKIQNGFCQSLYQAVFLSEIHTVLHIFRHSVLL